jgi:glyceraldehyde-3-phosphate dehydrogenase (NAD(P))
MTRIHVVGAGTIGAPLIRLLLRHQETLELDAVTFHKRSVSVAERPKLEALIAAGAELVAPEGSQDAFADHRLRVRRSAEEALEEATVILDCSPVANTSKPAYVDLKARMIVAQGSEAGFGTPYAWGVNDAAIDPGEDRFVQVVSCNTHAITTLLTALAPELSGIEDGRFVLLRRGNDIGQDRGLVGAPMPTPPTDPRFGTHHAHDAHRVLATLGLDVPLHSAALKVPTQLMHAMWFDVALREELAAEDALQRFAVEPRLALTHKQSANAVFSFGRDHGPNGRLLNHAVVLSDTVTVREGRRVSGFAFTPQDGNTLLSNLALVARAVDPQGWEKRTQFVLPHLLCEV